MSKRFKWGEFAMGGIHQITNLHGHEDENYASVAFMRDQVRGNYLRCWGCIDGQRFNMEADTIGHAKAAVEAKVSEIIAAKAAA